MRFITVLCPVGLFVGVGLGVGCTNLLENHCSRLEGDQTCAERGVGAYCSKCVMADDGCVGEMPDGDCYFPLSGGTTSTDAETTETTVGMTTLEPSTETDVTTGPIPCVSDAECTNANAPFCGVNGECGTCDETEDGDAACEGLDPTNPICLGETCVQCTAMAPEACSGGTPACNDPTHTCVQCTASAPEACTGGTPVCNDATNTCVQCTTTAPEECTDQALVCDDATNTCVPCTAHDQCGEAACNLYTGRCLPGDAVVHVGEDMEITTLGAAVNTFMGPGAQGTIIVHSGAYDEMVTVNNSRIIAFLAADDVTMPQWTQLAGNNPQLTVNGGATVLMEGLRLSSHQSSTGPALLVNTANSRAWLDRGRVVQNAGGGIVVQSNAELILRNCFVGSGADLDVDAIRVNNATLRMVYTTVGGGAVLSGGRARALFCENTVSVEVRNSILLSADPMPEVECNDATITDSATEADVMAFNSMWFNAYATGDFGLTDSGAMTFASIALWQAGDPLVDPLIDPPTDIDGDPRPTVDGTPDYAGADVPQ